MSTGIWPANAQILLYHVEWDGVQDAVDWQSTDARDAWFADDSRILYQWENVNQLQPRGSLTVPLPYRDAIAANYLVMVSDDYKLFYFINQWAELSPAASAASLSLDVWTSGYDQIEVKHARLVRGTLAIGDTHELTPANMREYLSEGEGLSLGDALAMVDMATYNLTVADSNLILVVATCDLFADWGTEADMKMKCVTEGIVQGMMCPEMLIFDLSNFRLFAGELRDAPWIAQCIQGCYVLPKVCIPEDPSGEGWSYKGQLNNHSWGASVFKETVKSDLAIEPAYSWLSKAQSYYRSCCGSIPILNKIFTSPFTVLTVSNNDGGYITLEPQKLGVESTATVPLEVKLHGYGCVAAGNVASVFYPLGYNKADNTVTRVNENYRGLTGTTSGRLRPDGDGLERGLAFANWPSMVLPVDGQKLYAASTYNAYNRSQSAIAEQKEFALQMAATSYSDTMYGLQMQQAVFDIQNEPQQLKDKAYAERLKEYRTSETMGSVVSKASGNDFFENDPIGLKAWGANQANLLKGDILSGLNDVVNDWNAGLLSMIPYQTLAEMEQLTPEWVDANRVNSLNYQHDVEQAGRNRKTADLQASFSAEQAMKSLQAARSDALHVAPGISGTLGGTFSFSCGFLGLTFKLKMPAPQEMRDIVQYWLGYGYADNRQIRPSDFFNEPILKLKTCRYWDYWQLADVEVHTDGCPQSWGDVVRGMLARGVRLWHNPEEVGYRIEKENVPVTFHSLPARM